MSNPDMPPQNLPASGRSIVSRKAAWMLVIIMTALLALALIAVVWGFFHQASLLMEGGTERKSPGGFEASALPIQLPPGSKILSSETAAGRLVLHIQTPQDEEIRIIDLSSGKLVQTIKTAK